MNPMIQLKQRVVCQRERLKRLNLLTIVGALLTIGGITVSAQTVTVLHSFNGGDGQFPEAALVQGTDGNFYGTTAYGGAHYKGTVFRVDSAGTLTTLHSFSGSPSEGANPVSGLVQGTDGNFYGTTALGGMHFAGTVFKIDSAGNLTTLHSFGGSDGAVPTAGLVQGADRNFYGTTALGGMHFAGAIFTIDSAGNLTVLHSFGGSDGAGPTAGLAQGTDGNFYGTTALGGMHLKGTVFEIDSTGTLTTLHSFSGSDGAGPAAGLAQGTDGNFYGTTAVGGAHYEGTLFKIDLAGNLTTLHSFAGAPNDGASPVAGLAQGSDGSFYGTTALGGAHYEGTVFKLSPTNNRPPVN